MVLLDRRAILLNMDAHLPAAKSETAELRNQNGRFSSTNSGAAP
jgi:hypothetical protein